MLSQRSIARWMNEASRARIAGSPTAAFSWNTSPARIDSTIAGVPLNLFQGNPVTKAHRHQIDEQVRRAAYHIIAGKGATYYGIGSAVARIVDVLLHDQRAILTICSRIIGVPDCEGVTLALPHLVGGEGALATIPLPLDASEQEGLRRSAGILREAISSLNI